VVFGHDIGSLRVGKAGCPDGAPVRVMASIAHRGRAGFSLGCFRRGMGWRRWCGITLCMRLGVMSWGWVDIRSSWGFGGSAPRASPFSRGDRLSGPCVVVDPIMRLSATEGPPYDAGSPSRLARRGGWPTMDSHLPRVVSNQPAAAGWQAGLEGHPERRSGSS
jgi:hypothetical protein